MLTYRSGGDSHGPAIVALLEGMPAGLRIDVAAINAALARRQAGFGRGARMQIEHDRVEIRSGIVRGKTTGAPLLLEIANRDCSLASKPALHRPRPGHADLAGAFKYLTDDARPILERASARETCARVAAGAVAAQLLRQFGVEVAAFVDGIGGVVAMLPVRRSLARWIVARERSELACPDPRATERMRRAIVAAARAGDTVGGTFTVVAEGAPPGLGSCSQWDERLDGRLAQALMSIPAIKGVEIGLGFASAHQPGSQVHDAIGWRRGATPFAGIRRMSNRAGGLEGGITNGEPIVVRAAMKPIATLRRALPSVDLRTKSAARAAVERSDVCAVPAASVVGEAMVRLELARALLAKLGGDSLAEMVGRLASLKRSIRRRFSKG